MDSVQRAKFVIDNNLFMTIASASAQGKPWSTPVGFTYDADFNFYWISSKDAVHSQNIAERPEIGLSIFGKVPEAGYDGVYIDAIAEELNDVAAIKTGLQLFHENRPQPPRFFVASAEEITGDSIRRMYRAKPITFYKRKDDTVNGESITIREKIEL